MQTTIFITVLLLITFTVNSQNIYTVAGNGSSYYYNGDSIPATSAGIAGAGPVALDALGNIYIADMYNNRIRKVDAVTGMISTVAGTGIGGYSGDGGPAAAAQIYYPMAVALDGAGNIYIGDYSNNRIRKVDVLTGLISTIAGTGVYGYNGDSIPATTAMIKSVTGIALDSSGNVYFSDPGNTRVRKIDVSTGIIYDIAGNGTMGYNGDSIPANTAQLYNPYGLTLDQYGNIYIADKDNNRVRKVDAATGIITTVAGSGIYNIFNGSGIPAVSATFRYPYSVAVDDTGNIYIADKENAMVHKVYKSTGLIYTIAGVASGGSTNDGVPALSAQLDDTRGVTVDDCGNVYISLYTYSRIRKIFTYSVTPSVTNNNCNGICNGTVNVSVSGGTAPYSYSWSDGLGSNTSQINLCAGTYTVIVTDSLGCKENLPVTISEPTAISIAISTVNATCLGNGSASASVTGGTAPYEFLWSNGDTVNTAMGLGSGNYYITVTDINNCTSIQTCTIINDPVPFQSVPICLVTVDSLSQHNIIVWDKTSFSNADTFIVYREVSTNNYQPIAMIPYDSMSQFIDTVVTQYFPNTGDPNAGTYRYKLQTLDSCGSYSDLSPYHNTIYFLNNSGTFYWTLPYTIEGGANPVSSYILMRDDNGTGNWQPVASVAGTQQTISDPLYVIYQSTASWRVKTQWGISCTPTKSSTGYSYSLSNVYTNVITQDKEHSPGNSINIYPNPAGNEIVISGSKQKIQSVEIYNCIGKVVYSSQGILSPNRINFKDFSQGIYYIRIRTADEVVVKKMVRE